MSPDRLTPNIPRLLILLLPAGLYLFWASYLRSPFEISLVDGSIGVLLGLYICSQPAANGIDLIFLQRGALRRVARQWNGIGWLALNFLVLFVGWLVIVVGTTQFTRQALFEAP